MSMFRRRLLMYQALMNKSDVINYPGLIAAWSAKGKTNDDADKAILKDLTGNGHDITLNGFAFSEMSGYGGYNVKHNFTYTSNNRCDKIERLGYKLTFINIKENYNLLFAFPNEIYSSIGCKIKVYVKGIPNGGELFFGDNKWIHANKDGIYEGNVVTNDNGNVTIASLNCIGSTISVEFLPEYPDALVFDGVDDYGINENVPILTDFTVICKREIFGNVAYSCAISKYKGAINDAFNFDMPNYNNLNSAFSYGYQNYVELPKNKISWMTPLNYNQQIIKKGTNVDGTNLSIGVLRGSKYFLNFVFYSAYLFNRSLDEQEIKAFIRKYIDPEYLLPSKIPTPDCYYDFSKGSNDDETRDTIKDLSGNGNDAVAHNFAWSGMSGYGGYDNIIQNGTVSSIFCDKISNTELLIKRTHASSISTFVHISPSSNKAVYEIKGLTKGQIIYFGNDTSKEKILSVSKNGIYEVDWNDLYNINSNYYRCIYSDYVGDINCTIKVLPKYEGTLVFDGVDDYVSLDAFDSGFKTVFIKCSYASLNTILYDQRKVGTEQEDCINTSAYEAGFYGRNKYGKTYINGVYNKPDSTLIASKLSNKHILITSTLKGDYTSTPCIASSNVNKGMYCNIALYKLLGFKEALTEEQINNVIKKYNLLDGVDEIEVS